MKAEIFRIARFGIVGVTATSLHVLLVLGQVELGGMPPLWANFIAFTLASLTSYLLHHRWTFAARGSHGRHGPRYAVVSLMGLGLCQGIFYLVQQVLGADYRLALAAVVVTVPAFTYLLSRQWTFRPH